MKKKNLELRIYELLGIKYFRKLAFVFRYILSFPILVFIKKTHKERVEYLNKTMAMGGLSNYNLDPSMKYDSLKSFVKWIYFNSLIHSIPFISGILTIINGTTNPLFWILQTLNLYCLILQRYNYVRIKKVMKRFEKKNNLDKEKIKEEIVKIDESIEGPHRYKIIKRYKKEKEIDVSLEDSFKGMSLADLKNYKKRITEFQMFSKYLTDLDYPVDYNRNIHAYMLNK